MTMNKWGSYGNWGTGVQTLAPLSSEEDRWERPAGVTCEGFT